MESDFLSSHTSRPCKRLLAPWKLILVKQKSKSSKQEVMQEFSEIAENDLLKSGFSDEIQSSANGLGGFKSAQVMIEQIRSLYHISDCGCDGQKYPRSRAGLVADISGAHTRSVVHVK